MGKYKLNKYTESWQEGLLLGNGRIGGIVLGKSSKEEFIISHHNNFLTTESMNAVPELSDLFSLLKIKSEKIGAKKAVSWFYEKAIDRGYEGLTMSDIVHPSLHFVVQHLFDHSLDSYEQILDSDNETVTIYNDKLQVNIKITDLEEITINYLANRPCCSVISVRDLQQYIGNYTILYEDHYVKAHHHYIDGHEIESVIKIQTNGIARSRKNEIYIEDYTFLELSVISCFSDKKLTYRKCESNSCLMLVPENEGLVNLETLDFKKDPQQFITCFYQLSIYYINAYSGQGIPGLQGIWAGDFSPAWSGDYTFDTNVQLAIDSYLTMGNFSAMKSVLEHLLIYEKDFIKNARHYFGCNGYLVPAHASTTALNVHWNEEWPLLFWASGAGWLGHYFNEYYKYTQDETFLAEKAIPFYENTLLFYKDYALTKTDFLIRPGYSAENGLGDNPTMDIAVIKSTIENLNKAYDRLKTPQLKRMYLEDIQVHLPSYKVNDGVVCEWIDEKKEENHNHRHFSHFYPVFVSKEVDSSHPLFKNYQKTFLLKLKFWLENEKQDTSSSHGKMQAMMIATALEMSSAFDRCFASYFLGDAYYNTLISSHYENKNVFNVDATGSFPKIIHDALIYPEKDGSITLHKVKSIYLPRGILKDIYLPNKIKVVQFTWDLNIGTVNLMLEVKLKQTIIINYDNQEYRYSDVIGKFVFKK